MSDIRQPLYGSEAQRVRDAIRRTAVPNGQVRATIAGHGQYQTTAKSLDALIEVHWDRSLPDLQRAVKDGHGDPYYDTDGLTRIELIMILGELGGHATN